MKRGYIRIYRKIKEWSWYKDSNTFRVFIHLLLTVNHKDITYKGCLVKRGSIVITLDRIAKELDLSRRQVRTAIDHLKTTNEVTISKIQNNTVITLLNYDLYQLEKSTDKSSRSPDGVQTKSTKSPHLNNYNNYNKYNNNYNNKYNNKNNNNNFNSNNFNNNYYKKSPKYDHLYGSEGAGYDLEAYEKYDLFEDPNSDYNIRLREREKLKEAEAKKETQKNESPK